MTTKKVDLTGFAFGEAQFVNRGGGARERSLAAVIRRAIELRVAIAIPATPANRSAVSQIAKDAGVAVACRAIASGLEGLEDAMVLVPAGAAPVQRPSIVKGRKLTVAVPAGLETEFEALVP